MECCKCDGVPEARTTSHLQSRPSKNQENKLGADPVGTSRIFNPFSRCGNTMVDKKSQKQSDILERV